MCMIFFNVRLIDTPLQYTEEMTSVPSSSTKWLSWYFGLESEVFKYRYGEWFQFNRPYWDRPPGRSIQSSTPKPLGHKGTWTTQSLTPPFLKIQASWLCPLSTKAGSFHSQANPDYRCHQCNGPWWDRTPGHSFQSPTPKLLGHKGTWMTQSLTLGWFVTLHTYIVVIMEHWSHAKVNEYSVVSDDCCVYSVGRVIITTRVRIYIVLYQVSIINSLLCIQE